MAVRARDGEAVQEADVVKSRQERERDRKECREKRCVHFTGLPGFAGNPDKCKAGVDYRALVGGPDEGWGARIPCLPPMRPGLQIVSCDLYQAPTPEELAVEDVEWARVEDLLARGLSPCCESPNDESRVIKTGRHKGHGPRFCSKCGRVAFLV